MLDAQTDQVYIPVRFHLLQPAQGRIILTPPPNWTQTRWEALGQEFREMLRDNGRVEVLSEEPRDARR